MTGIPHEFASRAEYDELIAALAATGVIDDGSNIYWDVRPSSHVETLEFRVADVCTTIDEAVMIAGLCRALARTCHAEHERGEPMPMIRPELLRAAKFRASRNGLRGDLIDLFGQRSAPASEAVETFLEFVRPALESAGEWDEVTALVFDTFARGNGADRQRAAYSRGGSI